LEIFLRFEAVGSPSIDLAPKQPHFPMVSQPRSPGRHLQAPPTPTRHPYAQNGPGKNSREFPPAPRAKNKIRQSFLPPSRATQVCRQPPTHLSWRPTRPPPPPPPQHSGFSVVQAPPGFTEPGTFVLTRATPGKAPSSRPFKEVGQRRPPHRSGGIHPYRERLKSPTQPHMRGTGGGNGVGTGGDPGLRMHPAWVSGGAGVLRAIRVGTIGLLRLYI